MVCVEVNHLGAVRFEVPARTHVLLSDHPAELFGSDEGMTPPELLLASLGACVGFYALLYLKKIKLLATGTRIYASAEKMGNPVRLDDFSVEVVMPVELTEEQRIGMEKAIHNCLIHQTLANPPKVEFQITSRKP